MHTQVGAAQVADLPGSTAPGDPKCGHSIGKYVNPHVHTKFKSNVFESKRVRDAFGYTVKFCISG